MFYYIPAELIALLTFPGVILHECAHRFFCDILKVPVYSIKYFAPSKNAGHVIHAKTTGFKALLIGIAPFIVNSLICMILTLPIGIIYHLQTDFIPQDSMLFLILYKVLSWIGYSIGFNAIPSDKDMENALENSNNKTTSFLSMIMISMFFLFNLPYIGSLLSILYSYYISLLLPTLYCNY